MKKKIPKIKLNQKKEKKCSILSMGNIDLTFKIKFKDEDLEIKDEEQEKKEDGKIIDSKNYIFFKFKKKLI